MDEERMAEMYKEPIPYIVYESVTARFERTIRRLIVAIIISVIALCVSNIAWLIVFNSYDVVSGEVAVDSQDGGNANYIGASGIISNGEGGSKEEGAAQEE